MSGPADPGSARAALARAQELHAAGRGAEAAVALTRAAELGWDDGHVLIDVGADLVGAGRMDDAQWVYRRACELLPGDPNANAGRVRTLIGVGRAADALAHCKAYFSQHPPNTIMLTSTVAAHYAAGDGAGARALMDFDRMVQRVDLKHFGPYGDLPGFNAALIAHLRAHPSLTRDPDSKTTRGGYQTGELLEGELGPVAVLRDFVRESATAYARRLRETPVNPFCARDFEVSELAAWGVLLDGDGHQLPHYHPAAWISAVYYARVPPGAGTASSEGRGWIQFGPPMDEGLDDPQRAFRAYPPVEGQLVIFPAFFFHGTIPTGSAEQRVCVAFDVS